MENTPNNNLISDICDAISTGYNFGGWTDPLDEGLPGPAEAKQRQKNKTAKFKMIQTQEKDRDRFLATTGKKELNAKIRDNMKKVNRFHNR